MKSHYIIIPVYRHNLQKWHIIDCISAPPSLSPRHSRRIGASRCLRNDGRSTASPSSRSRSYPPAARCRCSTRSIPGATACRSRRVLRKQPGRLGSWHAGSDDTPEETTDTSSGYGKLYLSVVSEQEQDSDIGAKTDLLKQHSLLIVYCVAYILYLSNIFSIK